MAGEASDQYIGLLKKFSRACLSLEGNDAVEAGRVCEIGKMHMQRAVQELVGSAGGAPMLYLYSSDGTPIKTKFRFKKRLRDGPTQSHSGYETKEYLVQNAFVRWVDIAGVAHTKSKLSDPMPLAYGKGAIPVFCVGKDFLQTLRQMGHTGISIQAFAFDRALHSALTRLFSQYIKHLESSHVLLVTPRNPIELLALKEWVVSVPCGMHDGHNALKWSQFVAFKDAQLLKDLYTAIDGLRNATDLLHRYFPGWIVTHLDFEDDENLPPQDELLELYLVLSVDTDIIDILIFDLHLWCVGGRVKVSKACRGEPDLVEKVSFALFGLWAFKQFTDSRWITVGLSCRGMLCGLLTGLDSLVTYIRKNTGASDFYIKHYDKLTEPIKKFVVVAAVSSHVSDGWLTELLKDGRVPLNMDALEAALQSQYEWLVKLPIGVWKLLAAVAGVSGTALRTMVMESGHVQIGFLHNRVIKHARAMPWALCIGDIEENLKHLKASEEPDDLVTWKIWRLLQLGYSMHQLVNAVSLLADIQWHTVTTEQLHGSMATLHRYHPDYGQETLCLRAVIHAMRRLVPVPLDVEKDVAKLRSALEKLKGRRSGTMGGRQVYFADLMGVAKEWQAQGRNVPDNIRKVIMKAHGARYKQLTEEQRRVYDARAASHVAETQDAVHDQITHLRAKIQQLDAEVEEAHEKLKRSPMKLSSCAWSAEDIMRMEDLLASPVYAASNIKKLRAKALQTPQPDPAFMHLLQSIDLGAEEDNAKPAWLWPVCLNRAAFSACLLSFPSPDGSVQWYKFLFAMLKPHMLALCPLERCECPLPVGPITSCNWMQFANDYYDYAFKFEVLTVKYVEDLPDANADNICVLPNVRYLEGGLVATHSDPITLKDFLACQPPIERAEPAQSTTGSVGTHQPKSMTLQEIRLQKHMARIAARENPSGSMAASSDAFVPQQPAIVPPANADVEFEEVANALEQQRAAWLSDPNATTTNFRVAVTGGRWLQAHQGRPIDSFKGCARGAAIEGWCHDFQMAASMKFDINVCGEAAAFELANAWVDRMQYFYDIWSMAPAMGNPFKQSDVDAYEWPECVARWELDPAPRLRARILQLRLVKPNPIALG